MHASIHGRVCVCDCVGCCCWLAGLLVLHARVRARLRLHVRTKRTHESNVEAHFCVQLQSNARGPPRLYVDVRVRTCVDICLCACLCERLVACVHVRACDCACVCPQWRAIPRACAPSAPVRAIAPACVHAYVRLLTVKTICSSYVSASIHA